MSQISFSDAEYALKKKKTRRELFLEKMERLIPWKQIEKSIRPYYATAGNGRRPYPLSMMIRIHCLQLFYNLSDPGMEDALYEIDSMRRFAQLSVTESIPDETTILNFRHLLERHNLGNKLFKLINKHLDREGLSLKEGTIVDATIIEAPTSTKNQQGQRDPEMHQVKKGNNWHFGMKMHIGTDDSVGLIHSVETTQAHVHDIVMADKLLHGKEKSVWGDAGYLGIDKRDEHKDKSIHWHIACRPGKRRQMDPASDVARIETLKAQVRAKVEHPFLYIKKIFGYSKVRYRGLMKNRNRLMLLSGFYNLIRYDQLLA